MKSLGECIYMAVISVYDDVGGVREGGGVELILCNKEESV